MPLVFPAQRHSRGRIGVIECGQSGSPAGIDVGKVVDTGSTPVINTGIAHKDAGIEQVGAGITRAPLACFIQAVDALAKQF
jgi:hypothetical protein